MKKITMYELLGLVKDGKASDTTTNFMFDRKKYNLLAFLDEYTLDINSLNWIVEIIEEEKKIPEKIKKLKYSTNFTAEEFALYQNILAVNANVNDLIDYLKSKGDE